MIITTEQINDMERLYRAAFVNSVGGYRSTVLIGTKSESGQENLAIFSSVIHLGSNPALYGFVMRPATVERHTLDNIRETKQYTFNHLNADIYKNGHQTSAKYDVSISEFEAVGLTPFYHHDFYPPFVAESEIKIAMQLEQEVPLDINGTILIIGRIRFIEMPDDITHADGFVDVLKAGSLTTSGLDAYYQPQKRLGRLSFARPNKPIHLIKEE